MGVEVALTIAVAILTSIFSGVIYFIMQRVERLEQDHRDAVDSIFKDIKEIGSEVKKLDDKADEKFVTKEYCRMQHRGEQ